MRAPQGKSNRLLHFIFLFLFFLWVETRFLERFLGGVIDFHTPRAPTYNRGRVNLLKFFLFFFLILFLKHMKFSSNVR